MRRLIINADDLGFTSGVNRAVMDGARAGAITSTTLMANSPRFEEAVAMAKREAMLGVGCHVVLVDGEPVLPASKLPTLAPGGKFRRSLLEFAREAVRGRIDAMEIEAEAAAQMKKIADAGIKLTHFDTHKHAHMFPRILAPVMRAAVACGVHAVRNPFVPVKPLAYASVFKRPKLWKRYSEVKILRRYLGNFRQSVREMKMATTDGCFGIVVTGALDQRLFDAIVGCIPEGTWEFVCHPGYLDDELRAAKTRLKESRAQELAVLTTGESREALQKAGVELISFGELVRSD